MFRFWKRKPQLPVTMEDREWTDDQIRRLKNKLGQKTFASLKTIAPVPANFDYTFSGEEEDARFVLERVKEFMGLDKFDPELIFFSNQPVRNEDGEIISTPADMYGRWQGAAGAYLEKSSSQKPIIYVEKKQLKDPASLISVMAHELSHEILLGQKLIRQNDEYLTDLTAIVFGFGIFMANTRFKMLTERTSQGTAWQMSTQGYLPEQIIAYAMAKLSIIRPEPTPVNFKKFLNKTTYKYYSQSLEYLNWEEKMHQKSK